jgi:putative membrane protein
MHVRFMSPTQGLLALALVAFGAFGCATTPTNTSTRPGSAVQPSGTDVDVNRGTISDQQILGALREMAETEVELARLALTKAQSAQVKTYANSMIAAHEAEDKQLVDFGNRYKEPAEDTDLSRRLEWKSDNLRKTLNALSGHAFDHAYMDSQIDLHWDLINTIDHTFTPQVDSGELRDRMRSIRNNTESHLTTARQIQQALSGGKDATTTGEGDK